MKETYRLRVNGIPIEWIYNFMPEIYHIYTSMIYQYQNILDRNKNFFKA